MRLSGRPPRREGEAIDSAVKPLVARDALCANVLEVDAAARPVELGLPEVEPEYLVVRGPCDGQASAVLGVLTPQQARAATDGERFGDLAGAAALELLGDTAPLDEVLARMDLEGIDAWPIGADAEALAGVVTRSMAWQARRERTHHMAIEATREALVTLGRQERSGAAVRTLAAALPSVALATGQEFLQLLVEHAAGVIGADYAFIGVLDESQERIRTLALYARGALQDNFEYDLAGTPCEQVVGRELCVHLSGVASRFPEDEMLVEMGAECYIGVPLNDAQGQPLGLMAVLHGVPLGDSRLAEWLLPVFGARAASELERIRIEHALRNSETRYRMLLEQASDGILLCDPRGRYTDVNAQACELTGYDRDELLQMRVDDLVAPEDLKRKPLMLPQLRTGEVVGTERWLKRRDGRIIPVDISARRLAEGSVLAIMRDISERKVAEEKLNDYYQMLHTIRALQSRYIEHAEPKRLYELMLRSLLRRTHSEYGFIGEVSWTVEDQPVVKLFAVSSISWNEEQRRRFEESLTEAGELRDMNSLFGSVVLLGAPVISNDPGRDPRATALPEGHPAVDSLLGLPLYVGGRLVGVAALANRPGGYPDDMPDFLEPLTTTCASIIQGHRQEAQRRSAEELAARLGRILDQTSGEILVFGASDHRFLEANRGARMELGYALEELRHLTLLDLLPHISADHLEDILGKLRRGEQDEVTFETLQRRKHGSVHPVEVRLQFSHAEEPGLFVAIVRDITARKQAEGQISYLVHYDSLTGLPNRLLLVDRLKQALVEASWDESQVAVLFLDLDRFKTINDTLGHDAGDKLIAQFAERLKHVIRRGDTIARLGGDEFAVIVTSVKTLEDVARTAQRVLAAAERPFSIAGRELFVSASIGITMYPDDASEVSGLLRNADTALHHAKQSGRNTYQFFTAEMNEKVVQQLSLETSLRRALERSELDVFYQPTIDLKSGNIIGAEALLRWRHPQLGMVPPERFIPLAEETGLIVSIGEWVLNRACDDLVSWHERGFNDLRVAVNLSPRQLQGDLVPIVGRALERSGLKGEKLEFELTESLLMGDSVATIEELRRLKESAVRFSIDDFGTGYSSLSYLKRFPFDSLKIDRSFVSDLAEDTDDAAIAGAIVAMAHRLGLSVTAEGVETHDQLHFLKRQGCDAVQGYFFSEPIPSADFAELLVRGLQRSTH